MAQSESVPGITQTRPPLSAWLGVVLLFFLFGAIVLAVIGPLKRGDTYEQTRAKKRLENLSKLREATTKTLTSYAWVDKTKGTVKIPIEQAMQLTMAELSARKVGPGGPIATPAPQTPSPETAAQSPPPPSASPKGKATPKPAAAEGPESENRSQPAAAANPPSVKAGTQPGANATPAATTGAPSEQPAASPAANPTASVTSGSPIPVRGGPSPSPSPH